MGETRVNLLHILEDLRDAYPGTVEETIITEVVANSLDSGARRISITTDSAAATLTVADDGSGMGKAALARYHDLAASTKSKGRSIGFAGVGIKLGLLISDEVVTESERKRSHRATSWRLSSKSRAPWRWIEPPGLQAGVGTTVRLYLNNAFSTLLEPGFIESVLLSHFRPLFDPSLGEILEPHYGPGVDFVINGRPVSRSAPGGDRARIEIRVGRQRKASGVGYLLRADMLSEDERGVAVSTRGKVIKRGWDWLGLSPAEADQVTGLVEIPSLVEALTLNKADFVRRGERAQPYLAYRKAVQDVISAQLREWGDTPRAAGTRTRRTRSLERDLRSVIAGLADDVGELTTLAERASGGQKKLPLGRDEVVGASSRPDAAEGETRSDTTEGDVAPEAGPRPPLERSTDHITSLPTGGVPGKGKRRPVNLGFRVRFESRPAAPEFGRLLESTVWVNDAHPTYHRAMASRSEGYHIALTAAMSLAPLAVEAERSQDFVTAFMAEWGRAGSGGRP